MVLPIGWTQSPPWFCTSPKTVTNIANQHLQWHWQAPAHHLDNSAATQPLPDDELSAPALPTSSTEQPSKNPNWQWISKALTNYDVFIDDFIGAAQGNKQQLDIACHVLLHSPDKLFCPLDPNDSEFRQEPASTKKVGQGNGCWATYKLILGWILDTLHIARLQEILDSIPLDRKQTMVKKWHKLLGELMALTTCLPSTGSARGQPPHNAQALHQWYHWYHTTDFYIPGPPNKMADNTSQLLSLSHTVLVAHFNSHFRRQPLGFLHSPAMTYFPQSPRHCAASNPSQHHCFMSQCPGHSLGPLVNLLP
jgi:hypothetical protein